jgi:RNA polymerase sigma factor (sigma-70 family)
LIDAVNISLLKNETYIHELETNEEFLVQECISRNRLAQKVVYEQNYSHLLSCCIRYSENQEEAEDILHDSFIKIFKVIHKFNGTSKLKTWLTRLVINEVLMYLRKKKRLPKQTELKYDHTGISEISEEELRHFSGKEVLNSIQKLPAGYKEILCLYSVDGYTHEEIGTALNISPATSRSQLSRARKLLKEMLKIKEVNHE